MSNYRHKLKLILINYLEEYHNKNDNLFHIWEKYYENRSKQ